jgi:hypothetical protein
MLETLSREQIGEVFQAVLQSEISGERDEISKVSELFAFDIFRMIEKVKKRRSAGKKGSELGGQNTRIIDGNVNKLYFAPSKKIFAPSKIHKTAENVTDEADGANDDLLLSGLDMFL